MKMKIITLASLTAGLMLSTAPVMAQMDKEQKGGAGFGSPQMEGSQSGQRQPGMSEKSEPKGKAGNDRAQAKEPTSKGTAQSEPKSKEPSRKGAQSESTGKESKGTANQATEPKEKSTKGTAEKAPEPQDKAIKGTAEKGSGGRVQVSDQQRGNIGQTLSREKNLNRVNVNISINVGTRVPRSVHLVALPATIVAIVPAYRSYHYFVVGDDLCIVDPATYEIVDVIVVHGQTASRPGGSATLVLTDAEQGILLQEINLRDGSTLGLGALAEGADVPRNVELRVFSDAVVERIPKLRGHKFFTAEDRLAIVDPQGDRVQLVIGGRR